MPSLMETMQNYMLKQKSPTKTEFGKASMTFLFKRMKWRFVSQSQRTKDVNDFINGLSKEAFDDNIDMLFLQINTVKSECKKYYSSKEQVKSIITRLPRFKEHESRLLEYIRKQRNKYKLVKDNG